MITPKSWLDASKCKNADEIIHPSGKDKVQWIETGKRDSKKITSLIEMYPEIETVLEYGCGSGRILNHIYGYRTYGVDICPEFVRRCKEMKLDVHLLEDFELKVDAIFSYTVFIHLTTKEKFDALKYCYEHLRSGGYLFVQLPLYNSAREPESWTHVGVWTMDDMVKACRNIGFEIIELHGSRGEFSYDNLGKNHGAYQILKKPLFKII